MMKSPASSPRYSGNVGILPFQRAKYFDVPLPNNAAIDFLHQTHKEIKKIE
jgi:hypothetical protein